MATGVKLGCPRCVRDAVESRLSDMCRGRRCLFGDFRETVVGVHDETPVAEIAGRRYDLQRIMSFRYVLPAAKLTAALLNKTVDDAAKNVLKEIRKRRARVWWALMCSVNDDKYYTKKPHGKAYAIVVWTVIGHPHGGTAPRPPEEPEKAKTRKEVS